MSADANDGVLAADLGAVVASVVLVAAVVFSPAGAVRRLAIAVGLPFVLVVPGYALVSAACSYARARQRVYRRARRGSLASD